MSSASTSFQLFATCAPGLEAQLKSELSVYLPGGRFKGVPGGLEMRVGRDELWGVAIRTRLAETLRVRIGRFKATHFSEFVERLRRLPWAAYLAKDEPIRIEVSSRKSVLIHSGALAERVMGVLDRPAADVTDPHTAVWVRVFRDHVTVSVDVVGGRLYRRGWRQSVGAAPMRETLAAAVVQLAQLDEAGLVWDPFCGSGTLLIEACHRARRVYPRDASQMAFSRWPIHDAEAYQGWRATLPGVRDGRTRFVGSDIDASAISAATENAVRAGVTDRVELHTEDMAERFDRLESGAALVSNTPYGKRLGGGRELRRAFNRFGDGLRRRIDIEHVTMVVGDRGFEKATGCRWREVVAFSNQGIPVRVLKLIR